LKFYTNVVQHKQYVHHFYIENGHRKQEKVKFRPSLGVKAKKPTGWKDIYGNHVGLIEFNSIFEMYKWKKENQDYADIYNNITPIYQFISKEYKQDLTPMAFSAFQEIKIFILDIEVYSGEGGFPFPREAKFPITAITVQDLYKDKIVTFGCQSYTPTDKRVEYIKCDNEEDLIVSFINFMSKQRPDMITGWNSELFDVPYIINRAKNTIEEGYWRALSPIAEVSAYKIDDNNEGYNIKGIAHCDYINVYKKCSKTARENYRLDTVAKIELGEGKLDYHMEFDSLMELYEKDFEKYIDYNIKDVDLIAQMNHKLSFLEVIMTQAFTGKVNFEDAFGSVKIWDIMIYNEMLKEKLIPIPSKNHYKEDFPGGFVMEPKKGMKLWQMVYDIRSSYPEQIKNGNISPETLVPREQLSKELQNIQDTVKEMEWDNSNQNLIDLEHEFGHYEETLKEHNLTLLANGEFFRRDVHGMFPRLVAKVFNTRVAKKKEASMLKNKIKEEGWTEELENAQKTANSLQYALKIFMNSFYGVFSNIHFRYYDIRLASAVTTMGQLSIRGPAYRIQESLPMLSVDYTDTDSLFISLDRMLHERFGEDYEITGDDLKRAFCKTVGNKLITPIINDYYQDQANILNLYSNTYEMDFEAIANSSIFVGKKRYLMSLVHDDGHDSDLNKQLPLKKTGVELVRSNTPEYVRNKLETLVQQIFNENNNKFSLEFLEQTRRAFDELSFEEIARPVGVKGLKKYSLGDKSVPIHVRAAHVYNRAIKDMKLTSAMPIFDGSKIKYCYIKTPNLFGNENVIACEGKLPEKLRQVIEIDYETQFNKTMGSPASIIFNALDWQTEQVASLDDFFD